MWAQSDSGNFICLLIDMLILSGRVVAVFSRSCKIKVGGEWRGEVSEKGQKKSNDQRVPVTRYFQIKEPRSLDMNKKERWF